MNTIAKSKLSLTYTPNRKKKPSTTDPNPPNDDRYFPSFIVTSRKINKQTRCLNKSAVEFRIRWNGYTSQDDTWEPEENFANDKALITEFYSRSNSLSHSTNFIAIKGQLWNKFFQNKARISSEPDSVTNLNEDIMDMDRRPITTTTRRNLTLTNNKPLNGNSRRYSVLSSSISKKKPIVMKSSVKKAIIFLNDNINASVTDPKQNSSMAQTVSSPCPKELDCGTVTDHEQRKSLTLRRNLSSSGLSTDASSLDNLSSHDRHDLICKGKKSFTTKKNQRSPIIKLAPNFIKCYTSIPDLNEIIRSSVEIHLTSGPLKKLPKFQNCSSDIHTNWNYVTSEFAKRMKTVLDDCDNDHIFTRDNDRLQLRLYQLCIDYLALPATQLLPLTSISTKPTTATINYPDGTKESITVHNCNVNDPNGMKHPGPNINFNPPSITKGLQPSGDKIINRAINLLRQDKHKECSKTLTSNGIATPNTDTNRLLKNLHPTRNEHIRLPLPKTKQVQVQQEDIITSLSNNSTKETNPDLFGWSNQYFFSLRNIPNLSSAGKPSFIYTK